MTARVPVSVRRIVYLGTPDFAVPPLEALHEAGYEIALVVSQPDARRGRGGKRSPSPVKQAALRLGLPVADDLAALDSVDFDLGVVVAYGRMIPERLLDRTAFVNIHFSLLPRWRGAAPLERAILAGDESTGACLMAVEPELDSGGIYSRSEVMIGADETLAELRSRLTGIGTGLLLDALASGFGEPVPQQGEPLYAAKINAAERELRWEQSAMEIHRRVRAGGAFTSLRGRRLAVQRSALVELANEPDGVLDSEQGDDSRTTLVAGTNKSAAAGTADGSGLEASEVRLEPGQMAGTVVGTGDGLIELLEVQPEGKPRRDAADWVNGARPSPADRLGS